jgi:2-polyprenyl-6-hydroxyphenyl methylase/3-demethylubiquinone-9 3-methyltransferase
MAIGARVRRMFGPLEPLIADCYRSLFFNVAAFARKIEQLTLPERVLEVGCGEGALATEMARLWPLAQIDGIDLTPRLGRLYRGERSRVRFQQISVQEFAAVDPGSVDLVVICDVMHHIPWHQHHEILRAAARALRANGVLVVKEWVRDGSGAYWLGYLSDRYITGDRIRYGTRDEWIQAFQDVFGMSSLRKEFSVAPWRCNRAFVLEPCRAGRGI